MSGNSALGRLVASVILDTAEFTSGVDKAKYSAAQFAGDIDKTFSDIEKNVKGKMASIAGALVAGFAVSSMKETFDSWVDGTAKLVDLARVAGSTVEEVSGIGPAAKLSGTSLEDVANAASKLGKSLISATNETQGAQKALNFLHIDAKDANGEFKSGVQLMDEIAGGMAKYGNSIAVSTMVQDAFGKSGKAMLPFLRDLAEVGVQNATITTQQAELARSYQQDLIRLGSAQSAVGKIVSAEVLPVADAFVQAFTDMITQTGGMRDQAKALAADGSIRDFAMAGVRAFGLVLNAGDSVVRIFKVVGIAIGGMMAETGAQIGSVVDAWLHVQNAEFGKAANDLLGMTAKVAAISKEWHSDIEDTLNAPLKGDSFVAVAEAKLTAIDAKLKQHTETVKQNASGYDGLKKSGGDAYDHLVESLDKSVAKLQTELDFMNQYGIQTKETNVAVTQITLAHLEATGVLEKHAKAVGQTVQALKDKALAQAKDKDALETSVESTKKYIAEVQKMREEMGKTVQTVVDRIQAEKDAIATYGMSTAQVTGYTIAQLEAKQAMAEATEGADDVAQALGVQIQKLKELRDLQGTFQSLKDMTGEWKEFSSAAGTFFADLATHGESAFGRLLTSLKNFGQQLIALFAQKLVLNIAANAMGGSGTSLGMSLANSAATAGNGSLAGGAMSLIADGASAFYGGMTGAIEGGSIMSGGFAVGTVGTADGLMASMGEGLAAMGPVGWIALAALAAYAIFGGKGGGPKNGGGVYNSYGTDGKQISPTGQRWMYTPSEADGMYQQLAGGAANAYYSMAKQFGGTAGQLDLAIGGDNDPQGSAGSRFSLQSKLNGQLLTNIVNMGVSSDPTAQQANATLQLSRNNVTALQHSGLQTDEQKLFDSFGDASQASQAQLDALIKSATELSQVLDALSGTTIKGLTIPVLQTFAAQGETISQTYTRVATAYGAFQKDFIPAAEIQQKQLDALTKQLMGLGMSTLPATRAGLRSLVEGLDLSDDAQKQLWTTIVDNESTLSTYYSALEAVSNAQRDLGNTANDTAGDVEAAAKALAAMSQAVQSYQQAAGQLYPQYAQQVAQGNLQDAVNKYASTAYASYVTGNSTAMADIVGRVMANLNNGTLDPTRALAYARTQGVDAVNALTGVLTAFQALQQANQNVANATNTVITPVNNFGNSLTMAAQTVNQLNSAQQNLAAYLKGSLLSNLSPLSAGQRLDEAHDQYVGNLMAAQGGDINAIANFSKMRDAYLQEARSYYASSKQYTDIFEATYNQGAGLTGGLVTARPVTAADQQQSTQQLLQGIRDLSDKVGQLIDKTTQASNAAGEDNAALIEALREEIADLNRALTDQQTAMHV